MGLAQRNRCPLSESRRFCMETIVPGKVTDMPAGIQGISLCTARAHRSKSPLLPAIARFFLGELFHQVHLNLLYIHQILPLMSQQIIHLLVEIAYF